MKTGPLLGGVCQVKTGAGADVVNVPRRAVILPRHAGLKLRFEMHAKSVEGTPQQLKSLRGLVFPPQSLEKSGAQTHQNPKAWIF